jgi:hypothetical protein
MGTEMAIFEQGLVDKETTYFSDKVRWLFWLGVILSKYRRWLKPYEQATSTESYY